MRISTGQIFSNANRNMLENQSSLVDIQDKISSGKKFTSLAEDPVGANRVVSLKRELAQLDMFQSNIDASRRRLELEETTLDNLNIASDRMRELILQAANGTQGQADREIIATELEELVEYAAGLMNTQDAKGEYLFSGSRGNAQTYVEEDGRYTYQGDATTRSIQIASALYVESTDAGQSLFESINGEPGLRATGAARGAFDADSLEIGDKDAFAQLMRTTGDMSIEVQQPTPTTYSFTLRDSAGNVINDVNGNPLQDIAYDGTAVSTVELEGVTFELDLPIGASYPGDGEALKLSYEQPQSNILNEMMDTIEMMRNPTMGSEELKAQLDERFAMTLDQLDESQERLSESISAIGSRLNKLEDAELANTDFKLMTEGTLSAVQDLDYASASTELAKRKLALEAAYASFGKIQDLSLFNYIR
ncbi:flagellar hook-associated protein FlgL [Marinobacterium maritimum]|uniref:Flagellar hook-associated protein FlgL n=1 Tax=Marinobacterium maritimum TaxID=500162 RepID=A0ABN1I4X1_9GAMM